MNAPLTAGQFILSLSKGGTQESAPCLLMEPLMNRPAIPMMKQPAIPLGNPKAVAKWLVAGCQKALHSHSAKSPQYGDKSCWLTPAEPLVMSPVSC